MRSTIARWLAVASGAIIVGLALLFAWLRNG